MRLIVFFGIAGAILAAGNLTAAQWQSIGAGLLTLVLRYGLTVLPWLLAALFAWLYWRQYRVSRIFRDAYLDKVANPVQRKRRTS